jgi:uncharacterized protein YpiB (UPF0302 family)
VKEGEEPLVHSAHLLTTEIILDILLLKREIDRCLDEGNKERFIDLTSELNDHEKLLVIWLEKGKN